MITCGVDIGSRSVEVVLMEKGQVLETKVAITGSSPVENAKRAFRETLSSAGFSRKDLAAVAATGYGRNYFKEADMASSEILCHAKGVSYFFPNARTVIDIGGQDSKMISLDATGKVANFVMNDRCAAGTGKFIEMVSVMLDIPLAEMGPITRASEESCEISSMCAVFAESEIIGLTQSGTPVEVVLRGVFRSIARRILSMTGKIGMISEVVFTGGVAMNSGVVRALEQESGMRLHIPQQPQLTGALGAAIIASERNRNNNEPDLPE